MVNKTDIPYTYENSENPWLMNNKLNNDIEINGNIITADYLWSLTESERIQCLNDVYNYYREKGFPYERCSEDHIIKEFNKLVKYDSNKVLTEEGYISNFGNLCLDLCRHFCYDKFWKATSENMLSIEDVFYNDELFKKVLKNRMGWNTTGESGIERPYMFSISDTMIRTGIRNSGQGYGVSNFRPTIAKFIYNKYLNNIKDHNPKVFDYSGGWGARAMAAASLGYDYYGVDPLTADNIEELGKFLRSKCDVKSNITIYKSGSENTEIYKEIPEVDMVLSCPPYFKLEVYSADKTQSYNEFDEFNEWINCYWKDTVTNCDSILKENGYFVLIIKDFYGKLPLKDAMSKVIEDKGYKLLESYQYNTSKNHLSGKSKTKNVVKNSEYVLIFGKGNADIPHIIENKIEALF